MTALHQERTHPEYVEGCFGCKAATLKVANIQVREVAHANERELTAYADARKQGIQPRSTRLHHTQSAVRKSDKLGVAVQAR